MDTFTCGTCSRSFVELDVYLTHKQQGVCTTSHIGTTLTTGTTSDSVTDASINIAETTGSILDAGKQDGTPAGIDPIKGQLTLGTLPSNIPKMTQVQVVQATDSQVQLSLAPLTVMQVQGADTQPGAQIPANDVVIMQVQTQLAESDAQEPGSAVVQRAADGDNSQGANVTASDAPFHDVLQVQTQNSVIGAPVTEDAEVQRSADGGNFLGGVQPNGVKGLMSGVQMPDNVTAQQTTMDGVSDVIYTCKLCDVYSFMMEEIKAHCTTLHSNPNQDMTNYIKRYRPLSKTSCSPNSTRPVKRKRGRPPKYPDCKLVQAASVVGIGSENIAVMELAPHESSQDAKPKRRPGRPRKSEQIQNVEEPQTELPQEQFLDEENLLCRNCKRKFGRLRQLRSHKCIIDVLDKVLNGTDSDEIPTTTVDDDMQMLDLSHTGQQLPKNKSKVIKVILTEEEQVSIEKSLKEHEIPQTINANIPVYTRNGTNNALKVYTCPYCEKFFKFKQGVIHHIRMHTNYKPFKCKVCSYASTSKGNLMVHERKHSGEQFKCRLCSYTTTSNGQLNVHIKRRHKNFKSRILCDLCSKNVYSLPNLLRHLKTSHPIDIPGKAQQYYEKKRMETREGKRSLLFQCNVCNRKFKTKREHDTHMKLHLEEKPFSCSLCDYKTIQEEKLVLHMRKHRQVYVCCTCKDTFLSTLLLKEHIANNHITGDDSAANVHKEQEQRFWDSINCSIYLAEFIDPELQSSALGRETSGEFEAASVDYIQGVPQGSNIGPSQNTIQYGVDDVTEENLKMIFKIDKCGFKFKRLNKLTYEAIQKLYGMMECKICGKLYQYQTHLENHAKFHQTEREFKCAECDYSTHILRNLQSHKESKHGGVQYTCSECGFKTTSKTYLQSHMRKHAVPDAFSCTRCDEKFSLEKDVKEHILDNHPSMLQEEIEAIIGRKTHLYRKNKKEWFQCKECPQKYRTLSEMRKHVWMHQGLTPYKCEICGHGTRSMSNLKTHMLRHSDAKTHLCDECGKSFKTKNSLKVHALSQHIETGESKEIYKISYSCRYCDFTCIQRSQFNKHLETHSEKRPFKCPICPKFYSNSRSGLRSHYSKQHPAVQIEDILFQESQADDSIVDQISYSCRYCDYTCTQRAQFSAHLDTHSENRPYKCTICPNFSSNNQTGLRSHYSQQHPNVQIEDIVSQENQADRSIVEQDSTLMFQYKCAQCPLLFQSHAHLEEHKQKEHNVEISAVEENAAETLIQAAQMAESSMEEGIVVQDDGSLQVNSAAELLQQIISMQGLGSLGGNQVQIQLPIVENIANDDSIDAVQAAYNISQSSTEDQQVMTANSSGSVHTYQVTQATQHILEAQAAGEDGSAVMQVQFRVEGGENGQQIFITQTGVDEEQQVVVVNNGEIEDTYGAEGIPANQASE